MRNKVIISIAILLSMFTMVSCNQQEEIKEEQEEVILLPDDWEEVADWNDNHPKEGEEDKDNIVPREIDVKASKNNGDNTLKPLEADEYTGELEGENIGADETNGNGGTEPSGAGEVLIYETNGDQYYINDINPDNIKITCSNPDTEFVVLNIIVNGVSSDTCLSFIQNENGEPIKFKGVTQLPIGNTKQLNEFNPDNENIILLKINDSEFIRIKVQASGELAVDNIDKIEAIYIDENGNISSKLYE